MKIVCEYCDSYVEVDENMKCPLCGGPLGTTIKAEQERIEQEKAAEAQRAADEAAREAEAKAQEAKEGHVSEIIAGITSVATAIITGKAADDDDEPEPPTLPAHPDNHVPHHEAKPPLPPDGRETPPVRHDHEIMHPTVKGSAHAPQGKQPNKHQKGQSDHRDANHPGAGRKRHR